MSTVILLREFASVYVKRNQEHCSCGLCCKVGIRALCLVRVAQCSHCSRRVLLIRFVTVILVTVLPGSLVIKLPSVL